MIIRPHSKVYINSTTSIFVTRLLFKERIFIIVPLPKGQFLIILALKFYLITYNFILLLSAHPAISLLHSMIMFKHQKILQYFFLHAFQIVFHMIVIYQFINCQFDRSSGLKFYSYPTFLFYR